MLTGLQIVVIGGDARQIEVIKKLVELDAKVSIVGFDQLDYSIQGAQKEKITEVQFEHTDVIVFPITGASKTGTIDLIFSSGKVQLEEEMIQRTPPHCTFFTGIKNPYLDHLADKHNKKIIHLFERDDVAIYNSIPTVEGTIMIAIQNTDFTIHGSNVTVLGFGRVGTSVARTFHHLGANLQVGATKSEHLARITEMNIKPFHLDTLKQQVKNADILINTIPAQVVTAEVIQQMPSHAFIIDLASKPGGVDFQYAEKRGIKAMLAPSLPGVVAPKTGGEILGNVLISLIAEDVLVRKGNAE